ncbi:MAG: fumarylacetoacetate hydrolase family protein, partial [Rhodospirillales bacterium]|nr:fumarylacetoacetate hydrolase family protein [Rhodospirillales bacterium]
MRFVTFSHAGARNRPGVVDAAGQTIVDLGEEGIVDLNGLVQQGETGLDIARRALKQPKRKVPLAEAVLGAPIPRPRRNIMCVGKNYFEHSKEFEKSGFDSTSGGQAVPDAPVIFTKAPSSVSAPGAEIPSYLDPTQSTDYEGELG